MDRPVLCLVEDDRKLATIVAEYLGKNGFSVIRATHGDEAERIIVDRQPDAVLLDVMLPGIDGFSVCKRVRERYLGPILFLTARDGSRDELTAFEVGADDFVRKPVEPEVLLARLRACLRRPGRFEQEVVVAGPLRIDRSARAVSLDDATVALTTAEFELLWHLAERVGRTVTREALHLALRGFPYDGLDRSIDLRVSRIRKKLGDDKAEPTMIKTVRGAGYVLVGAP